MLCQIMYITQNEKDCPLLHQMIPLAAAVFTLRVKDGPPCRKYYSRSYVEFGSRGKHILAQLYYYKCTSGPIHALLINLKSLKTEVIQLVRFVMLLQILILYVIFVLYNNLVCKGHKKKSVAGY